MVFHVSERQHKQKRQKMEYTSGQHKNVKYQIEIPFVFLQVKQCSYCI